MISRGWAARVAPVILAIAAGGAPSAAAQSERSAGVRGTRLDISGQMSAIQSPRQIVIRDQKAFDTLLKEHAPRGLAVPVGPVDFRTADVVAVFAGSRPTGGYSVQIGSVVNGPRGSEIECRVVPPAPGAMVTMAFTSPFAMRAVPKRPPIVAIRMVESPTGKAKKAAP